MVLTTSLGSAFQTVIWRDTTVEILAEGEIKGKAIRIQCEPRKVLLNGALMNNIDMSSLYN